jgi:hypothetical protein
VKPQPHNEISLSGNSMENVNIDEHLRAAKRAILVGAGVVKSCEMLSIGE